MSNDESGHRGYSIWERPQTFWAMVIVGVLALGAIVVFSGMIPRDEAGRAERAAVLEAQADKAEGEQRDKADADRERRTDLMN